MIPEWPFPWLATRASEPVQSTIFVALDFNHSLLTNGRSR